MQDFPHIGALFYTLRESRTVRGTTKRLTQQAIADKCNVHKSNISRFEGAGKISDDLFRIYIKVIRESLEIPDGVIQFLSQLRTVSDPDSIDSNQEALSYVSFEAITGEKQFIDELQREKRPSFIVDQLWFVHAFNAPVLRLFEITPNDLKRWESWHIIATKYLPDSPVREGHPEKYRHKYFPPACQRFFEQASNPFLFTPTMRTLLWRLQNLSRDFENLWENIVTFIQYYPAEFERTINYRADNGSMFEIDTTLYARELGRVEVVKGRSMQYSQVIWNPKNQEAETAFEEISKSCARSPVTFASEFIEDYSEWEFPAFPL